MSKFLKTLTTLILALTISVFFVACDDGETGGSEEVTTGELVYEIATGTREVDDGEEEYDYYKITGYTVNSEDALKMARGDFSSVTSEMRNIVIPNEYQGLPVEEIEATAFADMPIVQSVTFMEDSNIKTIGLGAFSGCYCLEEIINLPFIGKSADSAGSERILAHIFGSSTTITDGIVDVTSKVNDEEESAGTNFKVPASLSKVTVVADKVPECAFYGLTMLKTVEVKNATQIGKSAFNGCTKLISIALPKVESIYDNAFAGCIALQKVDFSENNVLTLVGDGAFSGCTYLGYNYVSDREEDLIVKLPSTVNYIGVNAFKECSLLKYIELGAGVSVLRTGTFAGCTELKKVYTKSSMEFMTASFDGLKRENITFYLNGDEIHYELSQLVFGEFKPE